MPLGVRDILLVIRAKDQASRTLNEVGRAIGAVGQSGGMTEQRLRRMGAGLVSMGASIGAVGAAGLAFLTNATEAAVEFDKQARLTHTQVRQIGTSLEDVKQVARNVASEIGVPFETLQPALYDIFSSVDVGLRGAEQMLQRFAKAAVAGGTDIQTVARSNFILLNAFGMAADDITNTNRLLDVQFKLVQTGLGTYEQINNNIGRIGSTATRAGQTIETMAGALAFATRVIGPGGAFASVGRAFEALANPKVSGRMAELGVKVKNAAGEFRPFNEILTDLGRKIRSFPAPKRIEILTDLFKGAGGTIQARRFLDTAILQFEDLNNLTHQMTHSTGELEKAFSRANGPAAQWELTKNRLKLVREEIGNQMIPNFLKLGEAVNKGLKWWNGLDGALRKNVVRFIAIGSVIAVVAGGVMTAVGAFLLLSAAVGGVGAALAILTVVPIVIAAIAGAVYLLVKNWDDVRNAVDAVLDKFDEVTNSTNSFVGVWSNIKDRILNIWEDFKGQFGAIWDRIGGIFKSVWETIQNWWGKFGPTLLSDVRDIFDKIWTNVKEIMEPLIEFFTHIFNIVSTIVKVALGVILLLWKMWGDDLFRLITRAWNLITDLIKAAINIIFGLVKVFLGTFNADWNTFWSGIKQVFGGIWDAIVAVLRGALEAIKSAYAIFMAPFRAAWDGLWDGIKNGVAAAWDAIVGVIVKGVNNIIDKVNWVIEKINSIPGIPNIPTIPRLSVGGSGGTPDGGWSSSPGGTRRMHKGGLVDFASGSPGSSSVKSDEVVKILQRGEFVLSKETVRQINLGRRSETDEKGGLPIIGDLLDWSRKNIFGRIMNFVGDKINPILERMDGPGPFGKLIGGGGRLIRLGVEKLVDWVSGNVEKTKTLGGTGFTRLIDYMRRSGVAHRVTSTLRRGDPGLHGAGKAADFAGPKPSRDSAALAAIFKAFVPIENSLKELIYAGPQVSYNIKNGRRVAKYAQADHHDHVHAGTFDDGGILLPGWNRVYNGTGGRESLSPDGGVTLTMERGAVVINESENPKRTQEMINNALVEVVRSLRQKK